MFKLAVIYEESDKRYTFPFEIATKTFKLSAEDLKKLEAAVKKEIRKL